MAEQQTSHRPGRRGACGRVQDPTFTPSGRRGGFSPGLFFAGLLALVLSVWAMVGAGRWELTTMVPIGWIIVTVAIVVGLVLVVSPRRRR
ncbi:hypothetical protein [Nocardia sp. NBC_01329]|uniref:hypothetical protein n=1 Tax=Nocardia sp. NBC_01329 TaxID=2903594 RepID=UPI002E117CF2|nr:hypothetical protein OG405_00840 [Nocardia sp. NBC_01329]